MVGKTSGGMHAKVEFDDGETWAVASSMLTAIDLTVTGSPAVAGAPTSAAAVQQAPKASNMKFLLTSVAGVLGACAVYYLQMM